MSDAEPARTDPAPQHPGPVLQGVQGLVTSRPPGPDGTDRPWRTGGGALVTADATVGRWSRDLHAFAVTGRASAAALPGPGRRSPHITCTIDAFRAAADVAACYGAGRGRWPTGLPEGPPPAQPAGATHPEREPGGTTMRNAMPAQTDAAPQDRGQPGPDGGRSPFFRTHPGDPADVCPAAGPGTTGPLGPEKSTDSLGPCATTLECSTCGMPCYEMTVSVTGSHRGCCHHRGCPTCSGCWVCRPR